MKYSVRAMTHRIRIVRGVYSLVLALGLLAVSQQSFATDTITAKRLGTDYPAYPRANYGTGAMRELIKRGEYLAKAGDCIACHTDTKNNGIAFAGGLGIKTPFGTFYTPNITADKTTGIGQWSDADFIRAMREGIAPNGSNYFPVFPYPDFNKLSTEDVLAIKAYLFSIPAIHQENLKNDVAFPFSVRFFQYGWKILFFQFQKGQYKYEPDKSKTWNRGAYLVEGLGHCGMCHTPHNIFGAEKTRYALTGGFVDGYFAPDITSKNLTGVASHEVVSVFTEDEMLRGAGKVEGPMAEVNHDSLQYLNDADLHSIAEYLKTVKSEEPAKTSSGKIDADTGKDIYEAKCAVCHASGAAGAPKLGDAAAWDPRIKQGLAMLNQHAIVGLNSMPPKGACMDCSDDEIKAAVQYLVDQTKPGAMSGGPKAPAPTVRLSLADGKKVYDQTCSVCHADGKLGAPKIGDKKAWAPLIAKNMDVLFMHSILGYKRMPPKGTCIDCSDAQIIAAVKYMVQNSKTAGDYSLW